MCTVPIIDSFPLMTTPYPIVIILSVYFWFVFKAGPQMMEKRKAINLKWIIICYNISQIIACCLIVERVSLII